MRDCHWAWRSRAESHLGNADGASADMAHARQLDPQVESWMLGGD